MLYLTGHNYTVDLSATGSYGGQEVSGQRGGTFRSGLSTTTRILEGILNLMLSGLSQTLNFRDQEEA